MKRIGKALVDGAVTAGTIFALAWLLDRLLWEVAR